MKMRVVIVEDEELARNRLQNLLAAETDVDVVGVCEDGNTALHVVRSNSPNLVFLDVQIPELNGFEFVQAIPPASRPLIIVVTGDEKHARKAFDFHAVDFLLKPFDLERFQLTLQRARGRIHNDRRIQIEDMVQAFRQTLDPPRAVPDRIAIKSNGRIVFVTVAEIDWISAVDNYCEIHVGRASHILRSTLSALEDRLPADKFVRISRSTVINVICLKELRFGRGCSTVLLQNGTELSVSDGCREKLMEFKSLGR